MFINFLAETKYPSGNVLPVGEAVSEGLFTTLYGLATVFAVLLIIMISIMIMRFCFSLPERRKAKKSEVKEDNQADSQIEVPEDTFDVQNNTVQSDSEIIAVITAAICASTGASQSDIVIRSFRRVKRENTWGSMGIKDQLNKSL